MSIGMRIHTRLALLAVISRFLQGDSNENSTSSLVNSLIDALPVSRCPENTYFVDWGSSGMKVHPVHIVEDFGDFPSPHVEKLPEIKFVGMGPQTTRSNLIAVLEKLKSKLADEHVGGRAFATAGFRLEPDLAHRTWKWLRAWNEKQNLLAVCSPKDGTGCHTLAGSDEAALEMKGMEDAAVRKHIDLGSPFAMASCGGASIQLGFWGQDEGDLQGCINDLGKLSTRYDQARIRLRPDKKGAYLSWLSNHNAPLEEKGRSDYDAGGIDEMRGKYDDWLELESESTNPCISPETDNHHSLGGICARIAGQNRTCLKDSWGSYITRLPGRPNSTRETCMESVESYLQGDLLLSTWHSSSFCRTLAGKTPEWEFLSAFSRPEQLGANIEDAKTWGNVSACIDEKNEMTPFETPSDLQAHLYGRYLTNVLLISFLRRLGLTKSATVQALKADVVNVAMKDLNLSRGWLTECDPRQAMFTTESATPAVPVQVASPTTSAQPPLSECQVPSHMEVTQMLGPATAPAAAVPIGVNTTVQVRCSAGFNSSQHSWMLTCRAQGKWEVSPDAGNLASGALPMCTPAICRSPVDELGVWLGPTGPNRTLRLKCASGYEPSDGPSHLACLEDGSFDSIGHGHSREHFARCSAIGTNTGVWRSRVFHNGLFSLVGLVIVVVVVVAACWREREPKRPSPPRTEAEQLMQPQERSPASMEVEEGRPLSRA